MWEEIKHGEEVEKMDHPENWVDLFLPSGKSTKDTEIFFPGEERNILVFYLAKEGRFMRLQNNPIFEILKNVRDLSQRGGNPIAYYPVDEFLISLLEAGKKL